MNNESKSIHEFNLDLISKYFSNVERQGPGSPEITRKALSFVENLSSKSQIADIGCGTGGQTVKLAQYVQGNIMGIDIFPRFIDKLNHNAKNLNLQSRVKGVVGSMDNLPFQDEELDLIWSEGAIYNIGFERGINEWRKFLKTGGYIAVSEATWFTNERPDEINKFWMEAYPEIDTISNKVAQIERAGYIPIATFFLPETCWIEEFFAPQEPVQKKFLEAYPGNKVVEDLIGYMRYEAELYNKYKDFYGYVFYIAKKTNQ